MDKEMSTEKLLVRKDKLSVNIEQLIENDISLADYYSDIVKILGICVSSNIFSCAVTSDKAVIDGNVILRIIYIDSKGNTEVLDAPVPFNRTVDIKNAAEGDIFCAECISEQVSCRAVNPRRIEARGSVTLRISGKGIEEVPYITDIPDGFCHTLKSSCDGYFLCGSKCPAFSVSAESEGSDKFKGAKICRIYTLPVISEIKTIKNKMMIRGNITATVIYVTEGGSFAQERITTTVNHITDIEGVDEDSVCCAAMRVISVDSRITPDTPQSQPCIELTMTVWAQVDAFRKGMISPIDEVYSTTNEIISRNEAVKFITGIQRLNESHTVSSKFDFTSCTIEKIDDVAIKRIKSTAVKDGDSLVIKGNIHYGIILTSKENEKLCFERIADFEYRKQLSDMQCETTAEPVISLNAANFSQTDDSSVIITAELNIDGFIYSCRDINLLSSLEKGAVLKRDTDASVITVYFAGKGESLWDIAKKHYTSVEAIKQLNDISSDYTESSCMLVFEQE